MTNLADKMLRCGTLQVGLHVQLDLINGSISPREDDTPAALMRSKGYNPVAEKPKAKEYLAAALLHLHGMSDPLPAQIRETVAVNFDANSTPADVCRDTVTALMSGISTFHAHTTVATSVEYSYLGTLGRYAKEPVLEPLRSLHRWFSIWTGRF